VSGVGIVHRRSAGFVPPSGEQFTIRCDRLAATVVEVGAGLRSLTRDDQPLVDGYGVDDSCTGARGQQMIPWPNRIRGGSYTWQNERRQLALDEPGLGHAIHGLTRWRSWRATRILPTRVELGLTLHPVPGYPHCLQLATSYELTSEGLTVDTTATNVGVADAPYAYGAHPYIRVSGGLIDDAVLTVPAATYLPVDETLIPLLPEPVAGTDFDFRDPRRIGNEQIVHAFTDLAADANGIVCAVVADPSSGAGVRVWADSSLPYLEIYTGDSFPEPERRRRSIAIEPMTAAPNAFVTGDGLLTLAPGQHVTTRWGISPC
jgi:aldose 1-epimerase